MVSNRKLFERFEKSDNWLPFLALAASGIVATIAVVSVAASLSSQSMDRGRSVLFMVGRTLGMAALRDPSNSELPDDSIPPSLIAELRQDERWSDENFRFLSAYDWSDQRDFVKEILAATGIGTNGEDAEPTAAAEDRVVALCWISEDGLSLLVLVANSGGAHTSQITSDNVFASHIYSITENGVETENRVENQVQANKPQLLITAAEDYDVPAPWQSVVSLDKSPDELSAGELLQAHREHIAGKNLLPIPTENVGSWVWEEASRQHNWLIDRGGMAADEIDRVLTALPLLKSLETSPARTLIHLGYQIGFSQAVSLQARQHAAQASDVIDELAAASQEGEGGGAAPVAEALVVVHACSHPTDLMAQLNQLPLKGQLTYVPDDIDADIELALSEGAHLPSKTKSLIADIESRGTLVHTMAEPFHAKFYRIKPTSTEPANE